MTAVELKAISKRYGHFVAVRSVSLDILAGEFFSLLGPSGCGKTTILRMIAGFEVPTSGEILLQRRQVNNVPPYLRETNLIFQHLALFPHLDVFDNVAFGLRMRRWPRETIAKKVRAVLDLVDLGGYESRRIYQLSGGQQQRVAIARALVNEPPVLLLDEPLGALDAGLRVQMEEELKDLQHRIGTTFVYVTHDQTEALTMSDRIGVMREGALEQVGSGWELYNRPHTRFVAQFLGEGNLLEGRVVQFSGSRASIQVGASSIRAGCYMPVEVGARAYVCVRPERMRLVRDTNNVSSSAEGANSIEARVRAVKFKGAYVEHRLVTSWEQEIRVWTPSNGMGTLPEGEHAFVTWGQADCCVVTE